MSINSVFVPVIHEVLNRESIVFNMFWIPGSSLSVLGGARGDQGPRMTTFLFYKQTLPISYHGLALLFDSTFSADGSIFNQQGSQLFVILTCPESFCLKEGFPTRFTCGNDEQKVL